MGIITGGDDVTARSTVEVVLGLQLIGDMPIRDMAPSAPPHSSCSGTPGERPLPNESSRNGGAIYACTMGEKCR